MHKLVWPPAVAGFYRSPAYSLQDEIIRNSVVVTAALVLVVIASLRWTRAVFVGFMFFFLAALPTMNFAHYTDISPTNRFAYLPCIGGYLLLCAILPEAWPGSAGVSLRKAVILIPVLLVAATELVLTHRYLAHWRDTEALFTHMVAVAPGEAKVQAGFGEYLTNRSRYAEAVDRFEKALRADPHYSEIYGSFAAALIGLGRYDEAWKNLSIALQAKPKDAAILTNKGVLLATQDRIDEAIGCYQEAARLQPAYAYSRTCWGMALAGMGRFREAVERYQEALAIDPEQPAAHDGLGVALAALGRVDEAIPHFREALRLLPEYDLARKHLDQALVSRKPAH